MDGRKPNRSSDGGAAVAMARIFSDSFAFVPRLYLSTRIWRAGRDGESLTGEGLVELSGSKREIFWEGLGGRQEEKDGGKDRGNPDLFAEAKA